MRKYTERTEVLRSRRDRQSQEKGIHELKRGIRKTGMDQEEREQERETMDKYISYATAFAKIRTSGTTLWCGTYLPIW